MNGSRSAAMTGGSTALSTDERRAATRNAVAGLLDRDAGQHAPRRRRPPPRRRTAQSTRLAEAQARRLRLPARALISCSGVIRGRNSRRARPRRRCAPHPERMKRARGRAAWCRVGAMALGDRIEQAIEQRSDVARRDRARRARSRRRGAAGRPDGRSGSRVTARVALPRRSGAARHAGLVARRRASSRPAGWLAMAALQAAAVVSPLGAAAHRAAHPRWFAVATSQLAGNGIAKVAPGGGAVGAALQYRMLVQSGLARSERGGRPHGDEPAHASRSCSRCRCSPSRRSLRGSVDRSLVEATIAGLVVFGVLFAIGVVDARARRPARLGRTRRPARPQPAPAPLRAAARASRRG